MGIMSFRNSEIIIQVQKFLFGKTGRNIWLVYFSDILNKIFNAIITVITIRVLDERNYGLYTSILSISAFSSAVAGNGLNMSMIRFLAGNNPNNTNETVPFIKTNFILQILQFMLIFVFIVCFSKEVSYFFFKNVQYRNWIVMGAVAGFGLVFMQYSMALSRAFENFRRYSILNNSNSFIILVAYLICLYFKALDLKNIILIYICVPLIFGIFIVKKEYIFNDLFENLKFPEIIKYFREEFFLILFFYVLALFSQINVFVVIKFKGIEELATYGVAQKYYLLILLLLTSISTVIYPKIARIGKDVHGLKIFLKKWLISSSCLIVPLLLIVLVSPSILDYLNQSKYPQANLLFQILCISAWFSLCFSPLTGVLVTFRKYSFLAFSALILQGVTLFLSIASINRFGIVGMVIVFTVMNAVGHLWSFIKTLDCLRSEA